MDSMKNPRYYFIDSIRGIALINMILFHLFYDIFIIYQFDTKWYDKSSVYIWQQIICWSFIFIAGVSWHFSKNNLKRGIFVSVLGGIVTLVTFVFLPSEVVWFGILTFIGCAILLMIPLHKIMKKINPYIGILVNLFCFIFSQNIQSHYLGFGQIQIIKLPQWLYEIKVFTIFGMPFSEFQSSDYFPIIPWIFLFCIGYFSWIIFDNHPKIKEIFKIKIPIVYWLGKESVWIYLLHQPICIVLVYLFLHNK